MRNTAQTAEVERWVFAASMLELLPADDERRLRLLRECRDAWRYMSAPERRLCRRMWELWQ